MTKRLYYTDSFLTGFASQILSIKRYEAKAAVELAETAFYPTSGGQPNDTGRLADRLVSDVFVEDGRVLHVVEDSSGLSEGQTVNGIVDWPRRFDHMQQHTGQHILSQAAIRLLNAPTEGFHLSANTLTVDLAIDAFGYDEVGRLETLANQIVWEDRPIRVSFANSAGDSGVRARGLADDLDSIRVVEIEDFDRSACGGTHVNRTGQVGLIKVLRWEKARQLTRVYFACGERELADYQRRHRTTRDLIAALGTQEEDLGAAVNRLLDRQRSTNDELQLLRAAQLRYQAKEWVERAATIEIAGQPAKLVVGEFELPAGLQPKQVAGLAIEAGADVAVIGCRGAAVAAVVMRRPGIELDCGEVVRAVASRLGLRGGGSKDYAQLGGFAEEGLAEVLAALREQVC